MKGKEIDKENTIKLVKMVNKRYNRLVIENRDLKLRLYFMYFLVIICSMFGYILLYVLVNK